MNTSFTVGKDDTKPSLRVRATTRVDGADVPLPGLTGATVVFSMRNLATDELQVNRAAAVVEDVANAILRYDWGAGDTDTAGVYAAEFEVDSEITVPNGQKIRVTVTEDVD